jgi:hypothetical protein
MTEARASEHLAPDARDAGSKSITMHRTRPCTSRNASLACRFGIWAPPCACAMCRAVDRTGPMLTADALRFVHQRPRRAAKHICALVLCLAAESAKHRPPDHLRHSSVGSIPFGRRRGYLNRASDVADRWRPSPKSTESWPRTAPDDVGLSRRSRGDALARRAHYGNSSGAAWLQHDAWTSFKVRGDGRRQWWSVPGTIPLAAGPADRRPARWCSVQQPPNTHHKPTDTHHAGRGSMPASAMGRQLAAISSAAPHLLLF